MIEPDDLHNRDTTSLEDERISCVDCAEPFLWSAGAQRFYTKHALARPKRCPTCRPIHRARFEARERTP